MAVALVLSRTLPAVREPLQDLTFGFNQFQGVELRQAVSPLYTPYFYLGLALILPLQHRDGCGCRRSRRQ